MYTIMSSDINTIAQKLKNTGKFQNITNEQKRIFVRHVDKVEIINTREVFLFSLLFLVCYKSYICCAITLNNGEKLIIDVSMKDMNSYFTTVM